MMLYRKPHMSAAARNYARAMSIFLLFAVPAYAADPPADAPTSVHLEPAQPAPFACRCLADAEHVKSEAQCRDDHDFRLKAVEGIRLEPIALVGIIAGVAAVFAAIGAGVAVAVKR